MILVVVNKKCLILPILSSFIAYFLGLVVGIINPINNH